MVLYTLPHADHIAFQTPLHSNIRNSSYRQLEDKLLRNLDVRPERFRNVEASSDFRISPSRHAIFTTYHTHFQKYLNFVCPRVLRVYSCIKGRHRLYDADVACLTRVSRVGCYYLVSPPTTDWEHQQSTSPSTNRTWAIQYHMDHGHHGLSLTTTYWIYVPVLS